MRSNIHGIPHDGTSRSYGSANDAGDDASLIAAARADPRAFAPLYDRYFQPIYRYCYVRLADREAAEDATSEIFFKALNGLSGYRDGLVAAWLFRIAHNVIVDIHRRRRSVEPLETATPFIDPGPSLEDTVAARVEREALRNALARLPAEQRLTVELQMAGWSGQRIAAVLGRSVAAVKMLRFRALERLRYLITAEMEPCQKETQNEQS